MTKPFPTSSRPAAPRPAPGLGALGAKHAAVIVMCGLLATGCSSAKDIMGAEALDLPEGQGVEDAPWPRLVDAPAPSAPAALRGEASPGLRSAAIQTDIEAEASLLREEAAALERSRAGGGGLRREAQAALAANAKLDAADRASANEQRSTVIVTPEGGAPASTGTAPAGEPSEADRIRAELERELNAQ